MPTILPEDFRRLSSIYANSKEGWNKTFHYKVCPDCCEDPPVIIEDFKTGDAVCGSCGYVLDQNIVDSRAEWRTFSNDDKAPGADPNRVGDAVNESLVGNQLATSIATDGGAGVLNKELQQAQTKLTKGSKEGKVNTHLKTAFKSLEAYVESAQLSQLVYDTATRIMKACMLKKAIKTNPTPAEYAVILYKATKHVGQGREMKECLSIVCLNPKKDRKQFSHAYKKIDEVLRNISLKKDVEHQKAAKETAGEAGEQMRRMMVQAEDAPRPTTGARSVLPRFCEEAGLKPWQRTLAEEFADAVDDTQALDSRGPSNVAATSLFVVTALFGSPITMKRAAELAGMSINTIKKAFVLATERKDQITGSSKFPKDDRLNLDLWPEIDGRSRVQPASVKTVEAISPSPSLPSRLPLPPKNMQSSNPYQQTLGSPDHCSPVQQGSAQHSMAPPNKNYASPEWAKPNLSLNQRSLAPSSQPVNRIPTGGQPPLTQRPIISQYLSSLNHGSLKPGSYAPPSSVSHITSSSPVIPNPSTKRKAPYDEDSDQMSEPKRRSITH